MGQLVAAFVVAAAAAAAAAAFALVIRLLLVQHIDDHPTKGLGKNKTLAI